MGDRAVVIFSDQGDDTAAVYLHNEGHHIGEVLDTFFDHEAAATQSWNRRPRFDDASYLAARFVHWVLPEAGGSVGIVPVDHTEHTMVRVHCDNDDKPRVEQWGDV